MPSVAGFFTEPSFWTTAIDGSHRVEAMTSVYGVKIKGNLKRLWIDCDSGVMSVKNHVHKIRAKFSRQCKKERDYSALLIDTASMELAHSLLLNEEALSKISDSKKPVFIFEWLRFLDKVLVAAQKSDIKESQQKLIKQLTNQITENPGPPTRKILARCLATIFCVGDTFMLFDTINKCNDVIRNRDDSPSYLPTKLAAICCIGGMYEKLGRMVGRSYEETVSLLIKALRNAESQGRCEIMLTLQKVVAGLGSAGASCYKDIYKAARGCLTDRVMTVRCASAKCMHELVTQAPFMSMSEVDNVASLCYRALDGSNYDARCEIAKLLGHLLATTQSPMAPQGSKSKQWKLDDVLNILATGFLKGGTGFLKSSAAGEMIKGGGSVNREIRVGITHAYVEFGKSMGGVWLEHNLPAFVHHVLHLVANPRAAPSHVDAVYARKCVLFVMRMLFGGILGETAQMTAAREVCRIIVNEMNILESIVESEKTQTVDFTLTQHILVCALHELGCLIQTLGTSASSLVTEPSTGILEPVVSVLLHPAPAARLAAAWCLRCIAIALPSQMTMLIDRCISRITHLRSSPEAISGYSYALAALLGGVQGVPLGIPHAKGKKIFGIAEELLRTATQNSRLSLQRTQAGWLLLSALMTLGPPVVKSHLPRMLLLWKNAFPRSVKELEAEKARGDGFTWQITLEGRAGALAAMENFLLNCSPLVTDDVKRRLLPPLECALTMLAHVPSVVKMYGAHLKASAAMVRLRLYAVLALLPPNTYEGAFNALLRELVAEFTLTDNPANTTTSLLRSVCHADDSVILGSWLQETDHKAIEDQLEPGRKVDNEHLQPNSASGSGALEHDAASLCSKCSLGEPVPGPLPLGVAVIDNSVRLYGLVFPKVPHKHRLQMLQHFSECIKQAKSLRHQAVQINIFTAVLYALKGLAETKAGFGNLEVRQAAVLLVLGALGSTNPILRCAAGEALGRMAQVVGDAHFIAEMAQYSFDKLKSARDVVTRTGHSLALGCLHRYVGGMGSGHHLNTSISILLALAQDSTSPVVQVWALHALALIADSGGPMFRGYVEPTLSLVLQLLLSVPPSSVDVHQCLGRCLAALITTLGPELQGNSSSVATARLSCLVCCAVMQDHYDSIVQAEAILCLQQCHLFAPRHVNLSTLVPHLCVILSSPHLLLRRAAMSCLRQLSQREAKEVFDHALALAAVPSDGRDRVITETGLEGALFSMLDKETDPKLCSDIQDTIVSMLQSLAVSKLTRWLQLIKAVLQASSDAGSLNSPTDDGDMGQKEDDDDEAGLAVKSRDTESTRPTVAPRWPTRVFAVECLLKIMALCPVSLSDVDPAQPTDPASGGKVECLVSHLSELVRMAFIAATSDCDKLRLAGLAALQEIITKFAKVPEPEFPGHVILEQYQAQVGAALRPAFSPDTAPDVTSAACEVCSCWIGSGVARDLNDLRRVHQLLVSSLAKLKEGRDTTPLYSESASTMEKLSVLRAWAEVYMVAMDRENEKRQKVKQNGDDDEEESEGRRGVFSGRESLLSLVQPEMKTLSKQWLAALKDHALLSLPSEYSGQLPPDGGTFYTVDTMNAARTHYRKTWPPILYAASLWLKESGFTSVDKDNSKPANMQADESDTDRFHLLMGICVEAMCSPTSVQPLQTIMLCLKSIYTLLDDPWPRSRLGVDSALSIELLNVFHRLLLTRDSTECFLQILEVVKQVVKSAEENLEIERTKLREERESKPANAVRTSDDSSDAMTHPTQLKSVTVGDGGDSGDIVPGKSVVFATLEVCLYVLVRHVPALNPSIPSTGFQAASVSSRWTEDTCQLMSTALQIMSQLPALCSPRGSVSILPTELFLMTGIIKELAPTTAETVPSVVTVVLQCLKTLCASSFTKEAACAADWVRLLQSSVATVLDFAKPDAARDHVGVDTSTLLLTLTVYTVSSPPSVMRAPNLLQPTVVIFKDAWSSKSHEVRLKCLQTLGSICQLPDNCLSTPFIHGVVPTVIEFLLGVPRNRPSTDPELAVVLEGIRLMESLIALAEDNTRIHLVSVLVPMLVSYLLDGNSLKLADKTPVKLHDSALQSLMKIGPQYPAHFRSVMQSSPDLRTLLEGAVKVQKERGTSSGLAGRDGSKPTSVASNQPTKPTITLKTNFGNFTG